MGAESLLQERLILVGSKKFNRFQRGVVYQGEEPIRTLCLLDCRFIAYPLQSVASLLLFPVTGIGPGTTFSKLHLLHGLFLMNRHEQVGASPMSGLFCGVLNLLAGLEVVLVQAR